MFLFHQINQSMWLWFLFKLKKLRKLYMKIWLSSSLDNSGGEEARINDRLCRLEVISWSLLSPQCLENVRQFSYSCLCFPGTRFLLDLTSYSTETEDQKCMLQVHCALNLVGSCFVMCPWDFLCAMPLVLEHLKFPVSSNAPCICDQLPPPCSSSQGIPGFMERNQEALFFFSICLAIPFS